MADLDKELQECYDAKCEGCLSEWESNFIEDVYQRYPSSSRQDDFEDFFQGYPLSSKQEEIIHGIWLKNCRE